MGTSYCGFNTRISFQDGANVPTAPNVMTAFKLIYLTESLTLMSFVTIRLHCLIVQLRA